MVLLISTIQFLNHLCDEEQAKVRKRGINQFLNHLCDDSKFLFQNLKRHVLSLKGRIKLIKTFSF